MKSIRSKHGRMHNIRKAYKISFSLAVILILVLSIPGRYQIAQAAPLEDCDLDGYDDATGVSVPWPGYDETKGDTPEGPGGSKAAAQGNADSTAAGNSSSEATGKTSGGDSGKGSSVKSGSSKNTNSSKTNGTKSENAKTEISGKTGSVNSKMNSTVQDNKGKADSGKTSSTASNKQGSTAGGSTSKERTDKAGSRSKERTDKAGSGTSGKINSAVQGNTNKGEAANGGSAAEGGVNSSDNATAGGANSSVSREENNQEEYLQSEKEAPEVNSGNGGSADEGTSADTGTSADDLQSAINTEGALKITDAAGGIIHAGSPVIISGSGFKGDINKMEIEIQPGPRQLGAVEASENGSFEAELSIPEDLKAGVHHIVLLYQGKEITRQQIEVGPKAADSFLQAISVGFTKDNKGLIPGLLILSGLFIVGIGALGINVFVGRFRRNTI